MAENGSMSQKRTQSAATEQDRRDLNRKLRLAFIQAAEERSRRELGRGLTADELRRVLERYPGDLPDR
jgi:uncharacterized protein involved in exopolysaccharide biosynthesis